MTHIYQQQLHDAWKNGYQNGLHVHYEGLDEDSSQNPYHVDDKLDLPPYSPQDDDNYRAPKPDGGNQSAPMRQAKALESIAASLVSISNSLYRETSDGR